MDCRQSLLVESEYEPVGGDPSHWICEYGDTCHHLWSGQDVFLLRSKG